MTRSHLARTRRRWFLALAATSCGLLGPVACTDDGDDAATATSAGVDGTSMVTESTGTQLTAAPAMSTTSPVAPTTVSRDYDFSAVSPIVQSFVAERGLNGAGLIVVERDDGVVYEQYWGEFDADRISLIASSSKMISAGVLLRLQDEGLLDIDAPVAEAVEWGQGNPTITPAQLLSNSSGLVGLFPDYSYAPYVCQWQASGSLQECAAAIFTTPDDDADIVAPDTEFRYGGAQWQVAGGVAEAVSGKSWDQLVRETYTEPCGLETLAFNNHWQQLPPNGVDHPTAFDSDPSTLVATLNPNIEAGAYVTTGDYAKLLLMHLRGGKCDDTQVLSQAALDQMHADRIGTAYDGTATIALAPTPNMGYGMGWWIARESGRLVDPGAYGATAWLDLEGGFGAYLVLESNMSTGAELATQLFGPVEAAVGAGS